MISIIVCSIKPALLQDFKNNVEQTIGVSHELIAIDNRNTTKGVCQVYNEGLDKANYDIVCFCHEDILFKTRDWGKGLKGLLEEDDQIGLVGICGATYKSAYPTPWISVPKSCYRTNIVKQDNPGNTRYEPILDAGNYSEVVVLDGCFMAGRRRVFKEYKWNDSLLKGFHLYDVDMSIRVGRKYKLCVANGFTLAHLSPGNFGSNWLSESERTHLFYKDELPIKKLIGLKEVPVLEHYALHSYLYRLIKLKQPKTKILKWLIELVLKFPFRKSNLQIIKMFITQ